MDNKQLRQPQDSARINLNEDYEVQYWTDKFNCTREQLKNAVNAVGVMADKVEMYLREK
jgi:hypothetical protein